MKVVITDNDTALLKSLEIVLGAEGHDVRTFNDPLEACRYLEGGGVLDVLVLDYLMPGMTGADLLTRVYSWRNIDFTVILISGHTDVFFLSGPTDTIEPDDLGKTGVHHFLPKPLDLHQLCRLVAGARVGRSGTVPHTIEGEA